MDDKLNDLNDITKAIIGMSVEEFAKAHIDGMTEAEMVLRVNAHVKEQTKDTFQSAVEEMERDK